MNVVRKIAFVAIAGGALALPVLAQSKPKVKPLATPPPTLAGAEIISRADDYIEAPVVSKPQDKSAEKQPTSTSAKVNDLTDRVKKLESSKGSSYDEKQKRLLLNLDILTRAEQRSESLRKQVFEMIEKENAVKTRLDQLEFDSRPEMIERSLQLSGSMKPEEIRDSRRKTLNAEKANLTSLLLDIQSTKANLTANQQKAEQMVEKIRAKLEKDIDDSFLKDDDPDKESNR